MKVSEFLSKYDDVSPYELAKLISIQYGEVVQPQRIYNEVRKGNIKSFRNSEEAIRIASDDALNVVNTWNDRKRRNSRIKGISSDFD